MSKGLGYFLVLMLLVNLTSAFAETKTVTLPQGTRVEKLGSGNFKFLLPDKKIIEVKNFDPKSGNIGYVSIIDLAPPLKPNISGSQGRFIGQKIQAVRISSGTEYVIIDDDIAWLKKGLIPKSSYLMIDDEPTRLPSTIQFEVQTQGIQKLSPPLDSAGSLKK
ncbi:MAG: hypothetical protein NC818_00575 [Candidatus Omnitrophica bacterium]|nr:hypothetical protein [Candidatus Omnitrophota bacterium]